MEVAGRSFDHLPRTQSQLWASQCEGEQWSKHSLGAEPASKIRFQKLLHSDYDLISYKVVGVSAGGRGQQGPQSVSEA